MTFNRRFFFSVATLAATWGLIPPPKAEARLPGPPEKKGKGQLEITLPCETLYHVGVIRTFMDCKVGDAIYNGCKTGMEVVGMALTDAVAGEPVMVMIGYAPQSSGVQREI